MRTPLTLTAKGTIILRGHPKGGLPGNFPIVKIANHARVWLNKNKPSDNEGFYTSKVKSIFRFHKNKVRPKKGRVARKNAGLVLAVTAKHHRSVLGAVAPRTKDGRWTPDDR